MSRYIMLWIGWSIAVYSPAYAGAPLALDDVVRLAVIRA